MSSVTANYGITSGSMTITLPSGSAVSGKRERFYRANELLRNAVRNGVGIVYDGSITFTERPLAAAAEEYEVDHLNRQTCGVCSP